MNCPICREKLPGLIAGGLTADEQRGIESHLENCPACRTDAQHYRNLQGLFCTDVDSDVTMRLVSALEAETGHQIPLKRKIGWPPLALAAGLLLFLGGWLLFSRAPVPSPVLTLSIPPGWSFVGGDAGNSRNSEALCAPQEIAWRTAIKDAKNAYKPLVCGNLIVVGLEAGKQEGLAAFDIRTGEEQWRHYLPESDLYKSRRFPDRFASDGRLYVTDGHSCRILDPRDGHVLSRLLPPDLKRGWNYLSSDGERLYGVSQDEKLVFAVDAVSGRTLWIFNAPTPVKVPALLEDRLYVHASGHALFALDARSGARLFETPTPELTGHSLVQARSGHVLVSTEKDDLALFGARDGRILWRKKAAGVFSSGAALGDDALYVKGGTVALSLATGEALWDRSGGFDLCATPTLIKNFLFGTGGTQGLQVLDLSGGVVASLADAMNRSCDGAIVSGGMAFTVSGNGITAFGCPN